MKVVFRIYPDGQVIALFPEESDKRTGGTMSYMHIGQHGDADYHGVIQQTKPATEAQYLPLFNELKSIGYKLKNIGYKLKITGRKLKCIYYVQHRCVEDAAVRKIF